MENLNTETTNKTDADVIAELAIAAASMTTPTGGIPFLALPHGYETHDVERLLPNPARKRAEVVSYDSDGFILYLKKHGNEGDSMIYAEVDSASNKCAMVAVIDDHAPAKANWRGHRCSFSPKISVELARWSGSNRSQMSQADFATWLEDNLPDIASVEGMPSGTEILTMALGFEANAGKRLRSKINLQSGGVQFEFADDEDKDTRTRMTVFERFTLGIPVFEGSASAYPLEARLKYREKDGKVSFWYELIRPDRVFKTAVDEEIQKIKAATGLDVIVGKP